MPNVLLGSCNIRSCIGSCNKIFSFNDFICLLFVSTSASNQAALEGFYQKQLSKDCSPLSIPALIAASSSGLSRDENNSDDDYD